MHTVSSQFLSRAAADAAVVRLVHAGFERRDISVSPLDEPHPPRAPSLAPTIGATIGGGIGAVLGGLGVPLLFAWLGQGHATHSTSVAVATGATISFVLGSRLGALVALHILSRRDEDEDEGAREDATHDAGLAAEPVAARPRVVVVRTVEALSRNAGRILERSGANHVSTEC